MQNDRRITLLKFYVISRASTHVSRLSRSYLKAVKFARMTTTINYAKLHCWRKSLCGSRSRTCVFISVYVDMVFLLREMPGGSNEIAFDGWHYVEGVISDARLQAFTALWSCFPFRGEPVHRSAAVGSRGVSKSKRRPHKWNIG